MPRRRTIRELKEQAAETMAEAQRTLEQAQETLHAADRLLIQLVSRAMATLGVFCEAVEEVMDGVTFEAHLLGKHIPIQIKLKPREDEAS